MSPSVPSDPLSPPRRWRIIWLEPQPIPPPVVPDLKEESFFSRAALVVAYQFRRFEYWLSPDGYLQAWTRLVLRLALAANVFLLGVDLVLLVLAGVVGAATQVAAGLAVLTYSLMMATVFLCGAVLGLLVFIQLIRVWAHSRRR